ncbi:acetate uptake transporter [Athalassotoga sp.]|uniref:acetate uptake transporter n=1 Tax=Athalassotoga sp. TaxID=2022597 RepID=UPI003CFE4212
MKDENFSNPGAVGLGGFALTTFVLNVANAGLVPQALLAALPLGIFYGGLAQFIAGLFEFKTGNTFGMTAFTGYGAFWMAFAFLMYAPTIHLMSPTDLGPVLGITFVSWTIFSAIMSLLSFRTKDKTTISIFILVFFLFLLLDIAQYTGSKIMTTVAGYEGIVTALVAWYGMYLAIKSQFN